MATVGFKGLTSHLTQYRSFQGRYFLQAEYWFLTAGIDNCKSVITTVHVVAEREEETH